MWVLVWENDDSNLCKSVLFALWPNESLVQRTNTGLGYEWVDVTVRRYLFLHKGVSWVQRAYEPAWNEESTSWEELRTVDSLPQIYSWPQAGGGHGGPPVSTQSVMWGDSCLAIVINFHFFSYCIHHEAYLKFSYSSPSHVRGRRYFYQGEEMRGREGDREGRRWVLCWQSGELTRNVTWSREKCLRQESKLIEMKSPMCQRAADIVYIQRGHAGCWRYPGKHSSARHGVAFRNL